LKSITHPAKFSDALMPVFASMLKGNETILDPFAGTGKIFSLLDYCPSLTIFGIEIESEWCSLEPRLTLGNALDLPYWDSLFDCVITSPCYGNRMADTLLDKYKRVTYTSALGRKLNEYNSGSLQWGKKYREFHIKAWMESRRVLKNKGIFILNIKNHIRNGVEQLVTEWHIDTLRLMGFELVEHIKVNVPSMGFGQNREARVPYESVIKFILYK
jgi:DNA modification methylase